ncbi:uncharacterized protein LOC114524166 [Dendronephthya gigantea]|uniref:uncharacterized protein LOC114524166 n=1 Tax=Dendronephthya gigantea TaxID=151771 RepID=UPI00106C5E3A|nr:uncharacterized protein LOC114524166 [Dendronephthya gigantea]
MLSAPLRIKSLFNEKLSSFDGIKLIDIRFETKVFGKDNSKLLPVAISFQANGTLRRISTVLDFSQLNVSLKSISEEIVRDVIGNIYSKSRRRRSVVDTRTFEQDPFLHSLKKYHAYCANFKNYHAMLYNVAISLYKLSSEIWSVEKELSQSEKTSLNLTNLLASSKFSWNQTTSFNFTLDDPEMSEALELESEEKRQNYEEFNSTNKLLVQNWFVAMESMFNSSRLHYECSGMKDCMLHILDSLAQMFSVVETETAGRIRRQIPSLRTALDDLSDSFDISIHAALNVSSRILDILKEMTELEDVCAQSPNITRHPDPVTELRVGKKLVLNCNATGTALIYSWTFNGEVIPHQRSNVLVLKNTTTSNSGNYTCIVSNHIAIEKSIPAVVTIHPPPIITDQSERFLAVVIGEDDELQCKVKETDNFISHEWWFKPANSSSFEILYNETFSYLGFSPMKRENEGWYFCRVSNAYGVTSSRVSFVKALSFTLPVPSAVLSFSLIKQADRGNSSVESSGYKVIQNLILKNVFLGFYGDGLHVKNLRTIDCQLGRSKNDTEVVGICSWKFQYVGKNMTTNTTVHNDFKDNAETVVNASQSLNERMRELVKATNNGSLYFSIMTTCIMQRKIALLFTNFH